MKTVRLLHRVAVDWTADTFRLRGQSARVRHDAARDRAYARARRLPTVLHKSVLHVPRQPRVLQGWQGRIGRVAKGQARI